MAKARDIAALAGLAGLAYAMRNKDKSNEDAGDQKTSSYTKDTKKVEASDDRMSNEDYIKSRMKKAPEAEDANYGNEGRRTSMGVAPTPKTTTKAAPKLETITTRKDPREAEASMSRGTRSVPNDNYSNEGRSSAKPPSAVSSSAEGMKNYKPRRNSTPANTASSSAEGMTNYKPRVTPPAAPFKGGQSGYDEAGNFLGGRRGYDEAGNPMKKGGAVKKMASGGMTASRRGDGIATKGKTRGKIC